MDIVEKYLIEKNKTKKEENIPSFSEYVKNSELFKKASMNFDKSAEAMGKSRWGETRRFAGKSAGIRIEKFDKSLKMKQKVLDKIVKEYEKKYNIKVSLMDKLDFL